MKMVKKGHRAFHVQDSLGYAIIEKTFSQKEVCELSEIEMLQPQLTQMVVQKNSRFRKIMAYSLRRITEHGILDREMKFWRTPKPKCVRKLKSEDIQVGDIIIIILCRCQKLLMIKLILLHFRI